MQINSINSYNCTFGDKILTKENQKMVNSLKDRFASFKENGLPVGDCYYKLPENSQISLKTNDKKFNQNILKINHKLNNHQNCLFGYQRKTVFFSSTGIL